MTYRPSRILSAALVTVALLASCGDDEKAGDEESEVTLDEGEPDDTDATDAAEETVGGNGERDVSGGGCSVTVEGDVSLSWSSPDENALLFGPWYREGTGDTMPLGLDANTFLMNCSNGDNAITVSSNGALPQEPGTYTLTPADNLMNGQDANDLVQVMVTLGGTDTNWGLEAPGTFTITEFDGDHIVGSFELPVKDLLAEMTSTPGKGSAVVKGTFVFTDQL